MSKLIVNRLYIFEHKNQLAKVVDFTEGINIVTTPQHDGNDRGKSVLMKSIYHTLGAEAKYDDKWSTYTKTYILDVSINDNNVIFYRNMDTFKIFDSEFLLMFETINRNELSDYLVELLDYKIMLNDRQGNLVLAPPVYSYLLNYIDQDNMDGPSFKSFSNLGQFANYKEQLIMSHFGVYNDKYYDVSTELKHLQSEEGTNSTNLELLQNMLIKIKSYLNDYDAPNSVDSLEVIVEQKKNEYSLMMKELKKIKNKLIKLRNMKSELNSTISDIENAIKLQDKKLGVIGHKLCPLCNNHIHDIDIAIEAGSELEDYYIVHDQVEADVLEIDRSIRLEREKYQVLLDKLSLFEKELEISTTEIDDVIRHKGYLETQERLLSELSQLTFKISSDKEKIKECQDDLKGYKELKKKANDEYCRLMIESKEKFDLQEINEERFKTVINTFEARGSNLPITTVVWYFNLLKVKNKLNDEAIKLPVVLDSPNNGELDDIKRITLFEHIFGLSCDNPQIIVSTLGFNQNDYNDFQIDNIIELTNDKYHVLNGQDYTNHSDILERLYQASIKE